MVFHFSLCEKYKLDILQFDVFSTVHHSIELFNQPTLMHNFLNSLTICLLHYYPRHVSSINMPIFRRKNCIHTASGIFALCKRKHSTLVESGLQQATYSTQCTQLASRLYNITTVTTGQITICSENAVWPPEDGRKDARNMLRNKWLTIKSLIVASSWSHIYLLIFFLVDYVVCS